jgi:hypothetical protein
MSLPHRAVLGSGAAATAAIDTDLANVTASFYSSSTSLHRAAAANGFRNDTQPHSLDLVCRWSTPCAATERERATRCVRM